MKVIIVTQGKIASGAEKVTSILYEDIKEKTLIVSGSDSQLDFYSNCGFETFEIDNLLPLERQTLGFKKIFEIIKSLYPLRRVIKRHRPDYIHVNNIPSLLYTTIASIGLKIEIVLQVHDFYSQDKLVKIISSLLKNRPSKIIAVSNSVKEDLVSIGYSNQNIDVVHNGIVQENFDEQERSVQNKLSDNIVKVLFIGSIAEWKGLHVLLKAAINLKIKQGLKVEYYVIGPFLDKEYEYKIRNIANKVEQKVQFMGKRSDVESLIKGMDILVHCSIKDDPFPTVVLEGMSSGLAVIASTAGGAKEIIQEGVNGMLHTPGNYLQLSEKLEMLINNPKQREKVSINALEFARSYLTKERYKKEFFGSVESGKGVKIKNN